MPPPLPTTTRSFVAVPGMMVAMQEPAAIDALNRYSGALVAVMRAQPPQSPPHSVAVEILAEVFAQYRLSNDFYAYLHAWAHHRAGFVLVGDWHHDRLFHFTDDPRHLGGSPRALHIGTTGGGDEYVARLGGPEEAIVCLLHDDLAEPAPTDFEGFVADLVFHAHDGGIATDLDEILGEEPF